jgi:starch synthase
LDELMTLALGLIILGSGDLAIQQALQQAAQRHVSKMKFIIGFDDPLAHRIIAGADILLIPSRYEPCGLTQMYAMKYGTIPIGRAVGGLNDTITPFVSETGQGNGFKFVDYDSQAFLSAVCQALEFFSNQPTWQMIMENAMQADFSWERSAQKYLALYRDLLKKTAEPPDQIKKEENLPRNTRKREK